MMDWLSGKWIGAVFIAVFLELFRRLFKRSDTIEEYNRVELKKMADKVEYLGVKSAEHTNKHARQDEINTNVSKSLERIEKGVDGVNTRLDNVIGNNRASS
jgi:tetrahydromethanopterin S-methyltransferase subunit G